VTEPRIRRAADGSLFIENEPEVARLKVDRTMPLGTSAHVKPEDLLLAMARMSRDGKSLAAIRSELEIRDYPPGSGNLIPNATVERALAYGRALLDQRIAQGLEPAETVSYVEVPKAEAEELEDDEPV
jgi:hypothetical protein